MICQEDNTLRRERGYHGGLHCTIDPINKGTTTLFLENNGANKGTTTLFLKNDGANKGTTTLFLSLLF